MKGFAEMKRIVSPVVEGRRARWSWLVLAAALVGWGGQDEVEKGRAIFEGKGNCTACHTTGRSSDKERGPDLADIGGRAGERAEAAGLDGPHRGTRFLIRSILRPDADLLDGYNPMPESWLPSGLTDGEIRSLIVYLQSLGGKPYPSVVTLPLERLEAKREDYRREMGIFSLGDPEKGRALFLDKKGNGACANCHSVDGEGADICPDLTRVRWVQRPGYLLESITNPSAYLVRGYQQLMIEDVDEDIIVGLPREEDDETITLVVDRAGGTEVVYKEDIADRTLIDQSSMPGNFAELLSAEEVLHLVAFLMERKGPEGAAAEPPSTAVFAETVEIDGKYRMAMEMGDPAAGGRIYRRYCVMCHGTEGDGKGFNAPNLETKPANHTLDRRMSKTEDRLLHGVVAKGGMKTGRSFLMPPWGGTLSQREIWDLVAYMRTLH